MYWEKRYYEIIRKRNQGYQGLSPFAGYHSLSPDERIIFNVGNLLECIELDGFRSFFEGVRGFYSYTGEGSYWIPY